MAFDGGAGPPASWRPETHPGGPAETLPFFAAVFVALTRWVAQQGLPDSSIYLDWRHRKSGIYRDILCIPVLWRRTVDKPDVCGRIADISRDTSHRLDLLFLYFSPCYLG